VVRGSGFLPVLIFFLRFACHFTVDPFSFDLLAIDSYWTAFDHKPEM